MKALSIKQPWASLIATGKKTIEVRTWRTNYRGNLLIVSSKKIDEMYPYKNFLRLGLPFGKAIAIARLSDCRPMQPEDHRAAMCPFKAGAFSWVLENVRQIRHFPVRGQLGFYNVELPKEIK